MSERTTVKNWYEGKNVFVTGATGFLGVALLEKLLRSLPEIGDVYLLLRPKKGKEVGQRLEEIKGNSVFEKLLETKSVEEIFKRVIPIAGDVGQPNLGLSDADRRRLVENVNVFFHSAATLDFAETLKQTVDVNLLGTRRCLELAKECRNLNAFVQVSSAYVNSWRLDCEEVIYPLTQTTAEELIEATGRMTAEELEKATPNLLGSHPNPYTITKHCAELEVQKMEAAFPTAIVRPSMIVGAWKEPTPGWTVSKNGPQGFFMGAAKGVIRRLPVATQLIYDYIPVDVVVNELIAAGFYVGVTKPSTVQVYHCTSSTVNPFSWSMLENKVNVMLHRYPLKSAVWYPNLKFVGSIERFRLSAFFVHIIPALILDFVTRISGGRPILMRLHSNVNTSLDRLSTFIFTEWSFKNDRTMELQSWLSPSDRKDFNLDITSINWPDLFCDLIKGARVYLNKESMKNLKVARTKNTIFMLLHLGLKAAFYVSVWLMFSYLTGIGMTKSGFIVPVCYVLLSLL